MPQSHASRLWSRLGIAVLLAGALAGTPSQARAARAEAPATIAPAEDSGKNVPGPGKKGRRVFRFHELVAQFKGDRLDVYRKFGFPPYRYFELKFASPTEHWIYPGENREFVFSGDQLVGHW